MALIDLNSSPYFDDFDEAKKYLKMLYEPDRAVQARELTQVQDILQNQIARFGQNIFKDGSMVIPGESAVNTKFAFIKLLPTFNSLPINLAGFPVGTQIVGTTSGAVATVLMTIAAEGNDPDTIYYNIVSGTSSQAATGAIGIGSNTISGLSINTSNIIVGSLVSGTGIPNNTFVTAITSSSSVAISNSANLNNVTASLTFSTSGAFADGETLSTITTVPRNLVQAIASASTGYGSSAKVNRGVYFTNGFFCLASGDQPDESQLIILDKYTNTPSYRIGLVVSDSVVTFVNDPTLNDPAQGFYNFNAPGADRYKIDLILTALALDDTTTQNFIELIRIQEGVVQARVVAPQYAAIEREMAQRTYDTNGNYTVKYFPMSVQTDLADTTMLLAALEPGLAYVQGNRIQTWATQYLPFPKARDTKTVSNADITFVLGNSVSVNHMIGTFNITNNTTVNLYSATGAGGSVLGTAKIRGQEFIEGIPGNTAAVYTLYLYDINMSGSNLFTAVRSIGTSAFQYANPILSSGNAILNDPTDNLNLIGIVESAIQSFSNVSYSVRRNFVGTVTGGSLTLSANTNELFATGAGGFANVNYQVSIDSASSVASGNGYSNGENIDMTSSGHSATLSGAPTGSQVVLALADIDGSVVNVIATIEKTNSAPKTKTLTNNSENFTPGSGNIQLSKADVYSITSIIDNVTTNDITSHYTLNNGQQDNYYNRGTLTFNTSYAAPTGSVTVAYKYFTHGTGDYFSVNTYNSVINYDKIQQYIASTGVSYDLIDTLDFRSRINDAGNGFSIISEIPIPNTEVSVTYAAYLPRTDIIVLNPDGTFKYLTGSSSTSPVPPAAPSNSMTLYNVSLSPYTFTQKDVVFTLVDNRNYTMQDIGQLATRISNIEYYTALSLLETQTSTLFIPDNLGNNMFKNGFVVDNFKTFDVCDPFNVEFKSSLDTTAGTLRGLFTKNNIGLPFDSVNSSHYQLTGNLLTLPYTNSVYASCQYASGQENINPYNIFNWVGNMTLTPNSDDWFEKDFVPDIVLSTTVNLSPAQAIQVGNTSWNDWTTTWVGQPTSVPSTVAATSVSNTVYKDTSKAAVTVDARFQKAFGRVPQALTAITPYFGDEVGVTATFTNIESVQEGQTRTGLQTNVAYTTTTQVIGSQVVDQGTVPYIRPNTVQFSATAMKPNTHVYPFFDNVAVSSYCTPSTLITDANGNVSGTFNIPDTATQSFRTGQRVLMLIDNINGDATLATTSASATYTAAGVLDTVQQTVQSTTTANLVQTTVQQAQVVTTQTGTSSTTQTLWWDPLAQSFLVKSTGGLYLSKIDIYFFNVDKNNIPVTLQIRNMVNGIPGQVIVPYSTVTLSPSQITTSQDSSVATSFVFSSPVYLQDGQEYCFVLLSNSNSYYIWTSTLGQVDVLTNSQITTSPYAGVMFKSKNASTWTPTQTENIKFNIWQCQFDTTHTASLLFDNNDLQPFRLKNAPLTTSNSSQVVNVLHPNHGLTTGQKATLSGIVGTQNGIPASELNGQHTITFVDIDHYTFVTATTAATASGICGGANVLATANNIVDLINVNVQNMAFSGTTLDWSLKTTPVGQPLESSFTPITLSNNINFTSPRIVYSVDNEGANNSMVLRANMSTDNPAVSPCIDITRSSMVLVGNRINNDSTNETNPQGGNAIAKYVTKNVSLTTAAEGITVYMSAIRPSTASIQVYVKMLPSQSSVDISTINWTLVPATNYPSPNSSNLADYTFQLTEQIPFKNFAVKIVMLTSDESLVPVIQNLRAIAVT